MVHSSTTFPTVANRELPFRFEFISLNIIFEALDPPSSLLEQLNRTSDKIIIEIKYFILSYIANY